ncbi:hypothetical protein ACQCSX_04250 [Pseudarthrobacter sp. P1]|uniref:hypothetical protein n=1 Tax=Pseudarthrobacter sp. P1 TaxID=3418418 RepID=UPI003CF48D69
MTPDQTKQLLAKAALIDNRNIDLETIRAWHEIIGHLDYPTALTALTIHRQESADYLQPAHIITNIRRARDHQETQTNRHRAINPTPPAPRSKMPAWFRDAVTNFGREERTQDTRTIGAEGA